MTQRGNRRNQNVACSARVSDPAAGRTAGLQNLSRSSFMETFGRAKCGVGRPAHSVSAGSGEPRTA